VLALLVLSFSTRSSNERNERNGRGENAGRGECAALKMHFVSFSTRRHNERKRARRIFLLYSALFCDICGKLKHTVLSFLNAEKIENEEYAERSLRSELCAVLKMHLV